MTFCSSDWLSFGVMPAIEGEKDDTRFAEWSALLLDQAILAEGGQLEDPAGFVARINQLMLALAG